MKPISEATWRKAQVCERAWWDGEAKHPERLLADVAEGQHWTCGILDIRPETVRGLTVLDIAAGPFPIAAYNCMGLAQYTGLDSLDYPDTPGVDRVKAQAETWRGVICDEVWGYNVLQHVRDPGAVLETARLHAEKRIRWLDWVDTHVHPTHPIAITADWLKAQLPGFRIVRLVEGVKTNPQWSLKFVGLVAERI